MGMPYILLHLDLDFSTPEKRDRNERLILLILDNLINFNVDYLRAHPETPKLYDARVRYTLPDQMRTPPTGSDMAAVRSTLERQGVSEDEIALHLAVRRGIETFHTVPWMIKNGGSDCDNLARWRAAEWRLAGVLARVGLKNRWEGSRWIYHAVTLLPDDTDEDSSLILGMGGPARLDDRKEEIRKNMERLHGFMADGDRMISAGRATRDDVIAKIKALGLVPKDRIFRC